jgi:thiol-disulfide isomerase/thioredoxin
VVVEKAPSGPVAELLVARRAHLQPNQTLLVDVGAAWCEPCRRFHDAAAAGQLDADFPGLVLLEFDWDVDRERLVAAGYDTQLIPLLALPGVDGRGTPRRLSGSVKGPGALDNLRPRLRALLDGRPIE